MILVIPWMIEIDRKKVTKPYSSGVGYPTKLSGVYLDDYIGEMKLNKYFNYTGVVLVAVLLIIGALVVGVG
jgi:hypothetical protein